MAILKSIGRYEIKGRIGAGGMGTLYLAYDTNPKTARLVAVKLLKANLDSDDLRRRFELEAQALAQLSHPNIVVIYDSGEHEDAPYIVMEFIRGETLGELIERRARLSMAKKLHWLCELCEGLGSAHDAGFIHRDVKPANLMVDRRGPLKILDFGIARSDDLRRTLSGSRLTRLNMQIGTPGYVSPEQIDGLEVDARSDVFAVGAVAYELFAYHAAFRGDTTRQIETSVLTVDPPPLASIVPEIDPQVAAAIQSALEKDPARRCPDVSTLRQAFAHARALVGHEDPAPKVAAVRKAGVDRRSRQERSGESAFEAAVAARGEGAVEVAKRSALEALAELPGHEAARQLLRDLGSYGNVQPWLPTALPAETTQPVSAGDTPTMAVPASRHSPLPTLAFPPSPTAPMSPQPRAAASTPAFTLPPPDPRLLLRSRPSPIPQAPQPATPVEPKVAGVQSPIRAASFTRPGGSLAKWVLLGGLAALILVILLTVVWRWR